MLSGFPVYHYFESGNSFSGEENGMRYLIAPGKTEEGEPCLRVTIWPGPWSREHTAPEKQTVEAFPANQEGLDAAAAWLARQYEEGRAVWDAVPSLLDSEPDL